MNSAKQCSVKGSVEDMTLSMQCDWTDSEGNHQGGFFQSLGILIQWQRGSLDVEGRNGAFLIDVIEAAQQQLEYYQSGKFNCLENDTALHHLRLALEALEARRDRRKQQGKFGTTQV
jgi:hypothetical protein